MKATLSEIKKNPQGTNSVGKEAGFQINRMPGREEEEQEIENLFEQIMKENSSNLEKEINKQVQEAQRIPNKLDPKRTTPRYIIIKMLKVKDKERILKAARE